MMALDTAVATVDPLRVEEAGLNALQTQRQLFYDGWLVRLSPGKAKRARCVNAHFGSTLPAAEKIARCEALYRRHDLPPLFRITPFTQPRDLERALVAAGYVAFDPTLVLAAALATPSLPAAPDGATLDYPSVDAFVEAVGELRASPLAQRDAHRERLTQSPLASRLALVRAGGRVLCAALIAIDGELAGIFDVVTAHAARGNGYATYACATLLAWAREEGARAAYLQVDAGNAPALAVYRKFGFATLYTYHYCGKPGECR